MACSPARWWTCWSRPEARSATPTCSCGAGPPSAPGPSIRIRRCFSRPTTGSTPGRLPRPAPVAHVARPLSGPLRSGVWVVESRASTASRATRPRPVRLALYAEDDPTTLAGHARAIQVGPRSSEIELAFTAASRALPAEGQPDRRRRSRWPLPATTRRGRRWQQALRERGVPVSLVGASDATDYILAAGRRSWRCPPSPCRHRRPGRDGRQALMIGFAPSREAVTPRRPRRWLRR